MSSSKDNTKTEKLKESEQSGKNIDINDKKTKVKPVVLDRNKILSTNKHHNENEKKKGTKTTDTTKVVEIENKTEPDRNRSVKKSSSKDTRSDNINIKKETELTENEKLDPNIDSLKMEDVGDEQNSTQTPDEIDTIKIETDDIPEYEFNESSFESARPTINDDNLFVRPKDKDRGHCYCGKDRNLNIVELLCANCNRWFHESCISYQLGKSVPFMMNYIFFCKNCSHTGVEIFRKNQATIQQLCISSIANLMQNSNKEKGNKEFFSKDGEIVPFIDSHWEGMTTNARRATQSWHATVLRSLTKEVALFQSHTIESDTYFGLANKDITLIKPNYEAMIKTGHLKVTDFGVQLAGSSGMKGRGAGKRKAAEGSGSTVSKKGRVEPAPVKLSAHGYPLEHPYNKDSYRYFLAEPDPHAPFRQEFDESSESAGKPIPGWLYRMLCPNTVLIALHDRAPQLKVTEDRLSITGEKGYSLARATHYVNSGTWYYEAFVKEMRDGSASRIGWGQPFANLQTPLGFDKFGYSWRSRKGTVFHEAKGRHFSKGYGEGDTLGFLIRLPKKPKSILPQTLKDRPLVKFKSHLYYEEKDNVTEIANNMKPHTGSEIILFKNGDCEGTAFKDIYGGSYHPAISLYKSSVVVFNFGPNFKHPPPVETYAYRPMSDRAEETICEQTLSDLSYLTENEGELKLDF